MKIIKIIKIIIATLCVAAIGASMFFACEKQNTTREKNEIFNQQKDGPFELDSLFCCMLASEIQPQIDHFQNQYAIDIVNDFIENEYYQQMIDAINDISTCIQDRLSQMTEEQMADFMAFLNFQMENLSYYESIEDYPNMLAAIENLSESLLCDKPFDEFVYETQIFNIPVTYIEEKLDTIQILHNSLSMSFPEIQNMSDEEYISLLSTALNASYIYSNTHLDIPLYLQDNPNNQNQEQLKNCIRSAATEHMIAYTVASALYTGGLTQCAYLINPYAIAACFLIQTGIYAYSVTSATRSYNTSVALCNQLYGS